MKMQTILTLFASLCVFNFSHATVTELTEEEREDFLVRINQVRAEEKNGAETTKMCWSEGPKEEVTRQANACEASGVENELGYFFRSLNSASSTDIIGDSWTPIYEYIDTYPMATCNYADNCGKGKILITDYVHQMYCVKTTCDTNIPTLYCGFTLSRPLTVGTALPYTMGSSCASCTSPDSCEKNLCIKEACIPPPPTTTTTTTATTEDEITMEDGNAMSMKGQTDSLKTSDPNFFMRMYYNDASHMSISYTLLLPISIALYAY